MPMDFLRRIESAAFPLTVTDESDIRNAIVLEAASYIEAKLPAPDDSLRNAKAVIFRITPLGQLELKRQIPT